MPAENMLKDTYNFGWFQCCLGFFFFRGVGASAAAHSLQDLRSGTRD